MKKLMALLISLVMVFSVVGSLADVDAVRDFVVRNLESLLSYWNEKISFDDLLETLRQNG